MNHVESFLLVQLLTTALVSLILWLFWARRGA